MPEIEFTIDGTTHKVSIDTTDPAALYHSGSEINTELKTFGYEFKSGETPEYQELALLGRDTQGAHLDLGDITNRVTESETPGKKGTDTATPGEPSAKGDVVIEVISPDGDRRKHGMDENQNLGALKAWINNGYDIEMSEQVKLYRDKDRTDGMAGGEMARRFDGRTLYWKTEPI